MRFKIAQAVAAIALLGGATALQAKPLTIALASEPTAMDPHYHQVTPNLALRAEIFDALIAHDANMNLTPDIATSWKNLDDALTWQFDLRKGVKFSNGQPLTAEDVVFTFCRVLHNEQAIGGSFAATIQRIQSVSTPDAHTLVIKTDKPYPLLPNDLSQIAILWNGIVEHGDIRFDPKNNCGVTGPWPSVADFNTGKDTIGSGPYKLKSYTKDTSIELTRNDQYWGQKPDWPDVKLVPVPSAGPRLAGLLSGDFDFIEDPSARDLPRIKKDPKLSYVVKPSTRVIFLQFDAGRSVSPQVSAPDHKNPLQDVRVRKAISMAIDRQAIVDRIMLGLATPAYQYLPDGLPGALAHPAKLEYNPEQAKKLLAEAGYPDGFDLTLSSTNDRYVNDAQIAQAVAQFLARVGIRCKVNAMTRSVYFPQRAKRSFSFAMGGWSSDTGEASSFLQYWVTTHDPAAGLGTSNYGRFSDPTLDKVLRQALVTMDADKRNALLQQSVQMTLDQMPEIPLHFEDTAWAFRKGLAYEGRIDQYTLASSIHKAP